MVSQLKVNEIVKQSGSSITIGENGDTVSGPFTNTPAFHVTLSSEQTIANTTETKIQWDSVTLDTGSFYDTTNYRYAPTVAGQYVFVGAARFQSSTDAEQCYLAIKKNGTTILESYYKNHYYDGKEVSVITNMTSGDYIEWYIHHNIGGNTNIPNTSKHQYAYGYRLIGV